MSSELPCEIDWCIADGCEARTYLDKCLGFDLSDEMTKDIVENTDMLFIQSVGVIQKKIRDAPEYGDTPLRRSAAKGNIKLVEQGGFGVLHGNNPNENMTKTLLSALRDG